MHNSLILSVSSTRMPWCAVAEVCERLLARSCAGYVEHERATMENDGWGRRFNINGTTATISFFGHLQDKDNHNTSCFF